MAPTIRPQSVLKGAGSYFLPWMRSTHQPGGTVDARYCYDVFLSYYSHFRRFAASPGPPRVLAEVGPGSSLGTGLAALLAGVECYIALDIEAHRAVASDEAILLQLEKLLSAQTPHATPELFPPPADPAFPRELANCPAPGRLERIRADLVEQKGELVRYIVPWTDPACIAESTVDWLISQAVLQHVDALADAYAAIARWLRPDGLAGLMIGFGSHSITSEWNGHWAIGEGLWRIIRGKRPYLLNRAWRSRHFELLRASGLELVDEVVWERDDGLQLDKFDAAFRAMPPADARTYMTFVVVRKAEHS